MWNNTLLLVHIARLSTDLVGRRLEGVGGGVWVAVGWAELPLSISQKAKVEKENSHVNRNRDRLRIRRSNRARVIQTGARERSQSREEGVERAVSRACLLSRASYSRSRRAPSTQVTIEKGMGRVRFRPARASEVSREEKVRVFSLARVLLAFSLSACHAVYTREGDGGLLFALTVGVKPVFL